MKPLITSPYVKAVLLLIASLLWTQHFLQNSLFFSDDIYFTYRVVDHFHNDFGLRWNIIERVQIATHPSWLLLNILAGYASKDLQLTGFLLSAVFVVLSALLAAYISRKNLLFALLFFIPPLFSQGFTTFFFSAFSHPLATFLLLAFYWQYAKEEDTPNFFLLSFFAAFLVLTRWDNLLFVAAPLLALYIHHRAQVKMRHVFLGFLPLIAWSGFALFYYGFIFPNTKYAKIAPSIPFEQVFRRGWEFFLSFAGNDVVAFTAIVCASALSAIMAISTIRHYTIHSFKLAALGAGVVTYLLYSVYIGGTYFHYGKLYLLPTVLSLLCFLYYLNHFSSFSKTLQKISVGAIVLSLLTAPLLSYALSTSSEKRRFCSKCKNFEAKTGAFSRRLGWISRPTIFSDENIIQMKKDYPKTSTLSNTEIRRRLQIIQERGFLIWPSRTSSVMRDGVLFYPKSFAQSAPTMFLDKQAKGTTSYYLYPNLYIPIEAGLGDAFLARLAPRKGQITNDTWKQGHLYRSYTEIWHLVIKKKFPRRYKDLRVYYHAMRYMVSGPLFEWARIKTILLFNMGHYDKYLHAFECDKGTYDQTHAYCMATKEWKSSPRYKKERADDLAFLQKHYTLKNLKGMYERQYGKR
jgi:MFS family permease